MQDYIMSFGGYLPPESAQSTHCEFCPLSGTNEYLATVNISYSDSWRNFGILWGYIAFNVAAAIFLYWLVRVPKSRNLKGKEKPKKE